jgi:hypothetical protein
MLSIRISKVELSWVTHWNEICRVKYASNLAPNARQYLPCVTDDENKTHGYDRFPVTDPKRCYRFVVTNNCVPPS